MKKGKLRILISCFLFILALLAFVCGIIAESKQSMLDFTDLARAIFCGFAAVCVIIGVVIWKAKDARGKKIKVSIVLGTLVVIVAGGIIDSKIDKANNSAVVEYGYSVVEQGDYNTQYFFSGKVVTVDEAYLILEVSDTGNSNLSEGAKVEVSTDVVSVKGCPEFTVGEYARVLMARNTEDNLPGRLEALSIYEVDENGTLVDTVHELKNGALEFVVEPEQDTVQMTLDTFKTNTTQIIVTTDADLGENEISVLLFSIQDGDEIFIGSSTLSEEETHRKNIFANLTSANDYKIGVSARNLTESVTILIAEE